MKQKRAGFFFYRAIYDSVSQLKKREKAVIYEAIFAYALDMEEPNMEGWSDTEKAIWTLAKPMLDNDLRRFENGCKGGAPKGNSNAQKSEVEKTTEKQPKNNQKQPTNNKNKKQEQETRIENNISLSLSPSLKVESREVADKSAEREKILEIFFFKNFINPSAEVDRFYAHYEAQGWKRSGGATITDRLALAQGWEPKTEGKRFSPTIHDLLAKWYNVGTPEFRHLLLTELIDVKVEDDFVRFRLNDSLRLAIERDAATLGPFYRETFAHHQLRYFVVTPS